MSPAFALLGSGEFEPWTGPIDRWLLARSPRPDGPVLILPTASAPEGDDVFDRWGSMGVDHFAASDTPAEVVPLKTRQDADRRDIVRRLQTGSMVYFSGGNPAYLASVLDGSAFWTALTEAMRTGFPYAGCSAGVNCLGETALDSAQLSFSDRVWKPGLRLFAKTWFGVHWDMVDVFVPGARAFIAGSVPPDSRLVAIDERTAMVGDGSEWTVEGAGVVSVMERRAWRTFPAGRSFPLLLPTTIPATGS